MISTRNIQPPHPKSGPTTYTLSATPVQHHYILHPLLFKVFFLRQREAQASYISLEGELVMPHNAHAYMNETRYRVRTVNSIVLLSNGIAFAIQTVLFLLLGSCAGEDNKSTISDVCNIVTNVIFISRFWQLETEHINCHDVVKYCCRIFMAKRVHAGKMDVCGCVIHPWEWVIVPNQTRLYNYYLLSSDVFSNLPDILDRCVSLISTNFLWLNPALSQLSWSCT